ncbi:MAG: hypothetical protein LC122_02545 [Chitinophagales bacterium]|nr:hypothetical protein [Chitinophagales bacterium]
MKSFYNDKEQWTEEGIGLEKKVRAFLDEIYKEYSDKDFKLREITGIIHHSASVSEAYHIIKRGKKNKNESGK